MKKRTVLNLLVVVALVLSVVPLAAPMRVAVALSLDVVISQVYGGGGNTGAPYTNDFVELFNRGTTPVSLSGWSVQYASATGTGNFSANPIALLSGMLAPGQYYLVQLAGGATGSPLPTPDATGTANMSGIGGKVVLVNTTTGLACNGGSTACNPTQLAQMVDLVGWDGANFYETSPAPATTNSTSVSRNSNGCTETDNNSADFTAGAPAPRNTASPLSPCPTATNPSGAGAATPASVDQGGSTLLTVSVTPGTNPASTDLAVACDLSAIGGSASQAFFDDNSNGDVTAGDNVFSFLATVPNATTTGAKSLSCTITDAQSRSGSASIALTVQAAQSTAPVVISQVYGGGGNTGATYTHDFIELYNRSSSPVSLAGWSVQYASAAGTSWAVTALSGSIQPGNYYLIQEAAGAGGSTPLPTPNATGSIAMSATAGKVALVNSTTALSGTGCPFAASVVDFVGYGSTANCSETSPTATLSNTTAAIRKLGGAQDTDNNSVDFDIAAPNPRNTPPPVNLSINDVTLYEGDVGTTTFSFAVSLTSPAGAGGVTFDITTADSTATVADNDYQAKSLTGQTIPAGSSTYTFTVLVNGDTINEPDETFFVNITNVTGVSSVTDYQGLGTILNDDVDFCTVSYTPIYDIQGSGLLPAITGNVATKGVVVGDYEGPSPAQRGFFIQDLTGDGDATTSDGIFVFNGNNNSVSLGDVVYVSGIAGDFQDQTQISNVTNITICGSGTVAPVDVTFPVPSSTYLEQFEGMLVRLPQTMYVTEHFQLGRFGQVVLSSGRRLQQPTNIVLPGAPALAMQAANDLNKIILDDALQNQNPDPILFGRGGNPLSASNTLRGGDTATGIVGIMTYTWSGNAASGNAYRLRPINALGGGVPNFQPANPRPTSAPNVGGTVKVVGMNLLNFFNSFTACFPSNTASDCRGASNAVEFKRQYDKTVAAILAMGPDVLGVNELENDGYGPDSSIQFLVNQLNAVTAPGTYAFIDADANTGQVNAMGSDAIRVALLYKPGVVTPIGQTAALNSVAFVNGGDPAPRNRASLAQAFQQNSNGAVFIVNVNHLKSKGSACTLPDQGDGQGNCNQVRLNAVNELMNWLATDPTGTGDPDIILVGDYNSYAMEDPIIALENGGFTHLIKNFLGPDAYSYVFDGQWGYLDHALATASLTSQVTGVADYHINADEPSVLDYLEDFKSPSQLVTLYAPNEFRVSDHDPVVVGLNLNAPPTVDAGGPYTVTEGSSVVVSATGSDPNPGDTLTYAWDLDNNGSFETPGQSATFSAPANSAPATYTIKVQVTDDGGLTAVDTATVKVIFNWTGFFQPVDNLPALNVVNAGRAIPVKFSLGGYKGLSIFAAGYPLSQRISCDTSAPLADVEETLTAGNSSLSYSAGDDRYNYVWKTEKSWAGQCRQLVVKLVDGTTHVANFKFK
jgi:predicted extracellular nuclease